MIKNITIDIKVNDIIEGRVVRITNFGAFVNLYDRVDGLYILAILLIAG